MQNRRRKKSSISPSRLVKRARSIERAEMRPFIKEIEHLKSEKYHLEQKLKNSEILPNSPKTKKSQEVLDLRHQMSEYQIIAHEQMADINYLRYKTDQVNGQLAIAISELANQKSANQRLEDQVAHATKNVWAIEFAKNMLSNSVAEMTEDYEKLLNDFSAKTAQDLDQISLLKNEMQMINKGCTEGAVKMAKIAKFEFEKVDQENVRWNTLIKIGGTPYPS